MTDEQMKAQIMIDGEDGRRYRYSRVLEKGKSTRILTRMQDGKEVEVKNFKEAQRIANSPEVL